MRTIPWERSNRSDIASWCTGRSKLGHPHPESNLDCPSNKTAPQPLHEKDPAWFKELISEEKGRSVPFWRITRYASGGKWADHSSSVAGNCFSWSLMAWIHCDLPGFPFFRLNDLFPCFFSRDESFRPWFDRFEFEALLFPLLKRSAEPFRAPPLPGL